MGIVDTDQVTTAEKKAGQAAQRINIDDIEDLDEPVTG
jgi:hypothetical protein